MRARLSKRTRTTVLAGVTLLAAGAGGALYFGNQDATPGATVANVSVYYTAVPVDAGTAAASALATGAIRTRSVEPSERPADAVTDPSQLAGRVAGKPIPVGTVVTIGMFPDPQTRIGTVVIPPGKRALALEVGGLPGVAGFVGAGDRIDVYGIDKGEGTPAVRLVVQGVEVLNVNGLGLTAVQGQPGSPNLVYLLAVTPAEAERLIYLNEFEKLYFDLMPKGEAPVKTPGTNPAGALAV